MLMERADQEWEVHRYQRRLYCLDDYKPEPPWYLINNDYMKMHYNRLRPNQYSYEFVLYSVCISLSTFGCGIALMGVETRYEFHGAERGHDRRAMIMREMG